MKFFETHLQPLTLVLIVLETMLLVLYELPRYLEHRGDRHRPWFMLLLLLLIHYNVWNGILPDPKGFAVSIKVQYMILDGVAYLMGAYFPFYFYKAFDLPGLRFYATYGVLYFLLLPYVVFVGIYACNGQLLLDRLVCLTIPAIYGLLVLVKMFIAIDKKGKATGDGLQFMAETGAFVAILPWEAMCAFAFSAPPQALRIMMANLGFIALALLQISDNIRHARQAHKDAQAAKQRVEETPVEHNPPPPDFLGNCAFYDLSETETQVAGYVRQGLSNKQIAALIFRGEETVKSHISNMLKKTGAKSRTQLVYLLEHKRPGE